MILNDFIPEKSGLNDKKPILVYKNRYGLPNMSEDNLKYHFWLLRDGKVIIEKYDGTATKEDILRNDDEMYSEATPDDDQLLCLTDITKASLDQISFAEMSELFEAVAKHEEKTSGMKLAFYNGDNTKEDYLKVSRYAKFEEEYNSQIKLFIDLPEAMEWLGLTKEEQKKATELLNSV